MEKPMDELYDAKLLIVDDEPALLTMLKTLLAQEGYRHIATASTAAEAREQAARFQPDALILDVMLPDGDGFSLLQQLRQVSNTPALFLSARDEDEARLRGLGLGADDYITKPFLPKELTLRLAAVLRRTYGGQNRATKIIRLGDVRVDMESGAVTGNGPQRTLTAKEFALLQRLNENRGRIVTIDSLCSAIWEGENFGYENTLMVHMRRLREKIEADPSHPKYLVTLRGLGYRLAKEEQL